MYIYMHAYLFGTYGIPFWYVCTHAYMYTRKFPFWNVVNIMLKVGWAESVHYYCQTHRIYTYHIHVCIHTYVYALAYIHTWPIASAFGCFSNALFLHLLNTPQCMMRIRYLIRLANDTHQTFTFSHAKILCDCCIKWRTVIRRTIYIHIYIHMHTTTHTNIVHTYIYTYTEKVRFRAQGGSRLDLITDRHICTVRQPRSILVCVYIYVIYTSCTNVYYICIYTNGQLWELNKRADHWTTLTIHTLKDKGSCSIRVYMYTRICVYMHTRIHMRTCTRVYICMHLYACIYGWVTTETTKVYKPLTKGGRFWRCFP